MTLIFIPVSANLITYDESHHSCSVFHINFIEQEDTATTIGSSCKFDQNVVVPSGNMFLGVSTDISAKSVGRVFWSGGNVAKTAAADFAKANGMKTLEMTTSGRIMNTVIPYLPCSILSPIWDRLFVNFARGAKGEINVVQNATGVGLNSTWRRIEYSILQSNKIIYNIVK